MAMTLEAQCVRLREEVETLRERVRQLEAAMMGADEPRLIPGLTKTETTIVRLIASRPGGMSKESIADVIYFGASDNDLPAISTVVVHVCKARRKLGPAGVFIETRWGWGWSMSPDSRARLRALTEGQTS